MKLDQRQAAFQRKFKSMLRKVEKEPEGRERARGACVNSRERRNLRERWEGEAGEGPTMCCKGGCSRAVSALASLSSLTLACTLQGG